MPLSKTGPLNVGNVSVPLPTCVLTALLMVFFAFVFASFSENFYILPNLWSYLQHVSFVPVYMYEHALACMGGVLYFCLNGKSYELSKGGIEFLLFMH